MSAAATARALAKPEPLTFMEAMKIINSMPFLVCTCPQKLLNSQLKRGRYCQNRILPEIYEVEFEVWDGPRSYVFPRQPFRVLRVITRVEFRRVAPWAATGHSKLNFCYHISSD